VRGIINEQRDDIRGLFAPSLKNITKLMKDQIKKTHAMREVQIQVRIAYKLSSCRKLTVYQKVILISGFGQSKALYSHLSAVLRENPAHKDITLICPQLM
jgi:hypothetical protein